MRHWKLKKLDMEVDDGAEQAATGTSGRGGRGRAATLAENDEIERERFMEVSLWDLEHVWWFFLIACLFPVLLLK